MPQPQAEPPASSQLSSQVLVRIEDAGLGPDAQVRLVVSGVSDPDTLRVRWASSGAAVESIGGRLYATTTVDALGRAAGRSLAADEAQALNRSLRNAVAAWGGPAPAVDAAGRTVPTDKGPVVMGVVNVTPDSFSDGGAFYPHGHPATAIEHARRLTDEGAAVIDVGGESTRPGADPVAEEEELYRVVPVVDALAGGMAVVSIDTRKPAVARAALDAGAGIVNDVSGAAEPALLEAVAERGAAYILMHTRGTPRDMQAHARYGDVVAEVYEFLADGLRRCEAAGVARGRVLIDPGIGFAKEPEHNIRLLASLRQFRSLGRPVVVGASRKSFLGAMLGGAGQEDRLEASLAAAVAAALAGAAMVRVHDVAATIRATKVAHAIAREAERAWRPLAEG
jgi:dihydropteroate synthase